jgi:FMN phosphatase YigB (HAD superfamily)
MQFPHDFSDISLITCDVFDTFLVRDSVTPARLWKRRGKWFSIARMSSEFVARVIARTKGRKEIQVAEIYKFLPKRWSIESEIDLEISTLRINPEVGEWLIEASNAGVRVVLISDIYFSATQLSHIIAETGGPTFEIITSSDEGTTKSTGLFQSLQKRWGIAPSRWVHMGDNLRADIGAPGSLGIRTVHYPRLVEQILNSGILSQRGVDEMLRTGIEGEKFVTELSLQFARFSWETRGVSKDVAELTGALLCGSIAMAISRFVKEVAQLNGSEVVWFSGRDGWIPFLFFERENIESAPAYFPVSRVAIESPNFETYVNHMVQEHKKILVFDIGWRGSLLVRLKDLNPQMSWEGAFVALIGARRSNETAMVQRFSRNWFSLVRNRDVIETLFSDPTPGIQSYDSDGRPLLKIEHDELNQDLRLAVLKGSHWAIETSTQELSTDMALKFLRVTCSYPSRILAERFLGVTHEINRDRRKVFVVALWRDLQREKDLSWWAGAHALRPVNRLAGFCWNLNLYSREISILISRTLRRYYLKMFH